ncbi:MAG: bacterial transcriptional activator domain-containing protein [Acidimicrobiia bacterium]|nr:bacterial transcriptional activator domain-containing protein [Acidimicrobiia bacterium]
MARINTDLPAPVWPPIRQRVTRRARWERGERGIRTRNEAALAGALGITLDQLRRVPSNIELTEVIEDQAIELPSISDYVDDADLVSLHQARDELVRLDNEIGAGGLIAPASTLLAVARHRLRNGAVRPHLERDLIAIVGEVAEITGWLAYDTEQHDLVRTMNYEALHWSRLVGDTSIELLTVQNAAMHASLNGHLGEAHLLISKVLESGTQLTPVVRGMFLMRLGRILAQRGDWAAIAAFEEARSLWANGPTDTDPTWAWWLDERELLWQEATARWDLGQATQAIEAFERSASAVPPAEVRSVFIHWAHLLRAQLAAGARTDAEHSAAVLLRSPITSDPAAPHHWYKRSWPQPPTSPK